MRALGKMTFSGQSVELRASNELRAYAAGLFDGEGSVSLARCAHRSTSLQSYTTISNTDRAVLDELQTIWGGRVRLHRRRVAHQKSVYVWVLSARSARKFLTDVYPFLRIKKQRAELFLAYGEFIRFPSSCKLAKKASMKEYTEKLPWVTHLDTWAYERMKALNRRGFDETLVS